jgi:hypothetical protein
MWETDPFEKRTIITRTKPVTYFHYRKDVHLSRKNIPHTFAASPKILPQASASTALREAASIATGYPALSFMNQAGKEFCL